MVYVVGASSNTPGHLRNTGQFAMLRHSTGRVLNNTNLVFRGNDSSRRASMVFVVRKYDPATGVTGGFQGSKPESDIVRYKKWVAHTKFVNSCRTPNPKNCGGRHLYIKNNTNNCAATC